MKPLILIILSFLCLNASFAQHEKTVVGEYCYYEQIDGQKSEAVAMPYTYHKNLELKFTSGYQISIKDKTALSNIIQSYSSNTPATKTLLGKYKPEGIAKGKKVLDMDSSVHIYWDGKKVIIEIPELTDAFGGGTAPNHSVFIPKQCIPDFIKCIKD